MLCCCALLRRISCSRKILLLVGEGSRRSSGTSLVSLMADCGGGEGCGSLWYVADLRFT